MSNRAGGRKGRHMIRRDTGEGEKDQEVRREREREREEDRQTDRQADRH